MTLVRTYSYPSGDCPVRVEIEWHREGGRHELRCLGNVLALDRFPTEVDLLTVSDPRFAEDSPRFFG